MIKHGSPDASVGLRRLVDIAWRWKSWLVATTVLSAATSLVLVAMTPKSYRASTTIIVTRQSVPESLVHSAVTLGVEERLKNLQVQVFSRSYLELIAREFALLPQGASESAVESACLELRGRVFTELDQRSFSWFRISVEDDRPERAAGIANRLAGLFIEQNSKMRASQAAGTVELTEGWEQRYRKELADRDAEIEEFNRRHLYALPDPQSADTLLLSSAQFRVAQLTSDIRTRSEHLASLRTEDQLRMAGGAAPGQAGADIAAVRAEITVLLASYTESNPLVKRKQARLAELVRASPSDAGPGRPATSGRLDPTSDQIATLEDDIKALEHDRERETANIASYRARIAGAPGAQQELLALTRGYDQVKMQFDGAVAQTEQAQRSQELEESNKGEQFQIQDVAYPPAAPHTPNPFAYVFSGIGFGLLIGVGGIGARELVVQTVRGEKEFAAEFPELPVYGVIPNLHVDTVPRRRR